MAQTDIERLSRLMLDEFGRVQESASTGTTTGSTR
jgi:hypothetical protein